MSSANIGMAIMVGVNINDKIRLIGGPRQVGQRYDYVLQLACALTLYEIPGSNSGFERNVKMKKVFKVLVIVIIVAFVVMQFFRIDKTAPPIVETETLEAAVT